MSLLATIMAMSSPGFEFVGTASHDETTSGVPLPSGCRVGDHCIFIFFPGRVISGGSGTAWTQVNIMSSTVTLAHRPLEAGDLSTPITLDAVSPVITIVYRGASGISAERTSVSFTGSTTSMAGFTKAQNTGALVGFVHGTGDLGTLALQFGAPWQASVGPQGPSAWFESLSYLNNPAVYVDGTAFPVLASVAAGDKYASVIEVLA